MLKRTTVAVAAGILAGTVALSGCSSNDDEKQSPSTSSGQHMHDEQGNGGHGGMDHSMDGGPAPAGIQKAASPKYAVGSEVTLTADHMDGMKGAKAKIVGAYKTHTYAIDYTPTTGGAPVKNHKWVVQEELKNPGKGRLSDGAKVVVEADHMQGMKGATATIASSTDETVYIVDYDMDGMTMKNHKWVVESEIEPA